MHNIIISLLSLVVICFCRTQAAPQNSGDETWTKYECKDTNECHLYGLRGHFSCVEGKCKCDSNAKYLEAAYACHLMETQLNSSCILPLDCSVPYSTCDVDIGRCPADSRYCHGPDYDPGLCACAKVCRCEKGRREQGGKCVKDCVMNSDCGENEKCNQGNCECLETHKLEIIDNKCHEIECKNDEDCPKYKGLATGMIGCKNKTCQLDLNVLYGSTGTKTNSGLRIEASLYVLYFVTMVITVISLIRLDMFCG